MVKPRTSVVIPAYNEAISIGDVIAECKPFSDEIIVVEDGSTDETAEFAENLGATVILHEENLRVNRVTEKPSQEPAVKEKTRHFNQFFHVLRDAIFRMRRDMY